MEANKSNKKPENQRCSSKPSRLSLFRSPSDSRRLGRGPASDSVQGNLHSRRLTKRGCPGTATSPRSHGAIDFDALESEMFRFTQGLSQPLPSSYHKLSDCGTVPKLKKYGNITANSPPHLPLPETSLNQDVEPKASPLDISQVYILPHHTHEGSSPSPMDTVNFNQRRKASMSKLMRHFGETRIPPELVLSAPIQDIAVVASGEQIKPVRIRKERTRSLDLNAFVQLQLLECSGHGAKENNYPVHRTRSLGPRSTKGTGNDNALLEATPPEILNNRVRRTRKMAQIFGPELSYELMVSSERHPTIGSDDPQMENELSDPPNKPTSTPPDSPSTPVSPTAERHRRTQKLAKFFGVNQDDISCTNITLRRKASNFPSTPQSYLHDVEVNVKVSGRRFWSLSADRAQYKHARMTDAIDQLRTLKSG